jgi:sec-independent protein translocase protein TatB
MFDFAWSEIGLIAAVALILIGPKDLPVAIRTITGMIKKARSMASEFQTHVDEMMREANLGEVREQISAIRNFDFRGEIERHVDPDHSLRDTFASNPLEPSPTSSSVITPAPVGEAAVAELDSASLTGAAGESASEPVDTPAEPPVPVVPSFVPPAFTLSPNMPGDAAEAPPFIPPQVVLQRGSRPSA